MSTSLLYWQQGIRVYRHQKIERLKGGACESIFRFPQKNAPALSVGSH